MERKKLRNKKNIYDIIEYKLLIIIQINCSKKIIALASSFDDNQFDVKYLKIRH